MDRAELMRQVRAGEYVVDPHAVAAAMLGRRNVREALLCSEVLEAAERNGRTVGPDERHAGPGSDTP